MDEMFSDHEAAFRRMQKKMAQRRWDFYNKDKKADFEAQRRCKKIQRTPSWAVNDPRIKELYKKAKEWEMQVDHVIPLQGKLVSGLHCWENLQLLCKSENCSKSNHFSPE